MSKSVFNANNSSWRTGDYPLVLGQPLGLYDSINTPYPELFDLYKLQKSMDWSEDEVNLEQSRLDLLSCSKNNYDIMLKTLAFQWELDSVASRAIAPLFAPFITNSELWVMLAKQTEIENLHALTYSEIIRQCIADPQEVFKEVMLNDNVLERSDTVIKVFDELKLLGGRYNAGMIDMRNPQEVLKIKQTLLKGFVALYCLEKIEFMSSFACTFALAEQNIFQGIAKLVQKIAQDEQCMTSDHDVLTTNGWKSIADVTKEDLVAQWDYLTGRIHFVNPTNTIHKKYTGEMFHLKSSNKIDQYVTDEHRIPVINPYAGATLCEYVYAKDYKPSGARSIPISGIYNEHNDTKMSALEKFYVAFQADGTYRKGVKNTGEYTGCQAVIFQFHKDRKVTDLIEILEELEFGYTQFDTVCRGKDVVSFYVKVPLEFVIDGIKDFSWVQYDKVGELWINEFMAELSKWDSHIVNEDHFVYCSTNRDAINVVQTLAHLSGRKASLSVTDEHVRTTSGGQLINAKEYYRLGIFESKSYAGGQAVKVTKTNVVDLDVYCISIPSTYFLVRRNGVVSITGNCHALMDEAILKILLADEEWQEIFTSIQPELDEIVASVVKQEFSWNKYLFSEGRAIVGLNEQLLNEWVLFNAQGLYDFLGLTNPHKVVEKNPLVWMLNWLDLNKTQNANQEADNTNYRLNSVVDDSKDELFEM